VVNGGQRVREGQSGSGAFREGREGKESEDRLISNSLDFGG
jgi:hypothetical protein